jgi:putative hydrolase of the HAD superfamily
MPTIQAIFFDIGDTLVFDDPPLKERLMSAAQAVGLTLDPARLPGAFRAAEAFAVERYVAGIVWDAPGALRETVGVLWSALGLPPLSDSQWAAFASAFIFLPFTRFVPPEAFALLDEIKRRGFTLGAISDWEDTLPDVLFDLGLLDYFDALAISAVVGKTKPNPLIFQDALAQVGLPPDACLHVGDWYELDAAGAKAAGLSALLFDWAGRSPDADCPRVTDWPQLTGYLRALPAPDDR